jgi:AcrR family transcriptional regulator
MQPPSPPPRRQRRKGARPSEIVEAALALFGERGFAATRLEDVALRAGVSKGTVYLYFPTKEDLFRAVLRQGLLPNLEAMEAAVAADQGPAPALLHQIAERLVGLLDSDLTAIPKLVLAESGNFPAIAQLYADEVVTRAMALLTGILTRGIERGELRRIDPQSAIPSFIAPFLMMALWKHSIGRHTEIAMDPKTVMEAHMDLLLRGLEPRP